MATPTMLDADFVVVGAGSAGCVLANRLSADPRNTVLVLEAGGDDRPLHNPSQFFSNLNIQMPAGFANILSDPKVSWGYESEPDPMLNGRGCKVPRGRVLGGSSSLNGMVYVRSLPEDYDRWRQMGCVGWAWDDVLPLYKRNENVQGGDGIWQGTDGPLSVSNYPMRLPTSHAFLKACEEAGLPVIDTINGARQEGVCFTQQTTRNGRRNSAAMAFLHPVAKRPNLDIRTGAFVTRILFEGRRATGVEYRRNGETVTVKARREIVLAGGAINSPQLLQLSGVGPGELLSSLDIPTLVDNAKVGANLQDHLSVPTAWRLKPGTPSLNERAQGIGLLKELLRYASTRTGLLSGAATGMTGYLKSRPELDLPDFQIFASPASADFEQTAKQGHIVLEKAPGFTLAGFQMRPQSTGSSHIVSADPDVHPRIITNYLSAPTDQIAVVDMLTELLRIMRQPSIAKLLEGRLYPDPAMPAGDRDGLLEFAKNFGSTAYHPSCTCAMGGEGSVVDPELRVRGVEGLRVADASIMPMMASGNLNSTCIMIGEKAAEMMLAR